MLKKLLMALVMLFLSASAAFAQVDVNRGDQATLESIKGIGPKISQAIIDERNAHGAYKDWADFERRVKGVADKKAAALSQAGLTVNGQSMSNAPATPANADKKAASPVSSSATSPSKPGMQTDATKNGVAKEPSAVTQNAIAPSGKPSAPSVNSAKTGQSTTNAPAPPAAAGAKATTPINGSANAEGKTGVRTELTKKSNGKQADGSAQNPAASSNKPAIPAATSAK